MFIYTAFTENGIIWNKKVYRVFIGNRVISEGMISGSATDRLIAGICDGLRNSGGGGYAAEIAAYEFVDFQVQDASAITVSRLIHRINKIVCSKQSKDTAFENMATAIAGCCFYMNRYLFFGVGNIRIYRYCDGKFLQRTKDYVEWNMIGDSDNIKCQKSVIDGYIGGDGKKCSPNIYRGKASDGEVFIIETEGVYQHISDVEQELIMSKNWNMKEKGRAILQLAQQNGSHEDRSIVLIGYSEDVLY